MSVLLNLDNKSNYLNQKKKFTARRGRKELFIHSFLCSFSKSLLNPQYVSDTVIYMDAYITLNV